MFICVVVLPFLRFVCVCVGLGGVCATGYANGGGGVPFCGICARVMSGALFRVLGCGVFCARFVGMVHAYFRFGAAIAGLAVGTLRRVVSL